MNRSELENTAKAMAAKSKGILAWGGNQRTLAPVRKLSYVARSSKD